MKKAVFTKAWELIKSNIFSSFADALKAAWKIVKLHTKLKAGVVNFSFIKKDGTIRNAIGTLCTSLFTYESKGSDKVEQSNLLKYYDLEANAFRSFIIINLL